MALSQDNRPLISRLKLIRFLMALILLGFVLKLWHLTIVKVEYYKDLAQRNQVRTVPLKAPRGLVFDRDGRVLIENVHSFSLFLYRDECNDLLETVNFLVEGLGIDSELLNERLADAEGTPKYTPVLVGDDLELHQLAYLLAHQREQPALKVFEQPRRRYRNGETAAHVLGFVGEIARSELERDEFQEAGPGDIVGKSGLERNHNPLLTGRDGYSRVLVTSYGKVLEEVDQVLPVEGQELHLTLDLDLQKCAEEKLAGRPGAIVVFEPHTGAILAMASSPAYDPNLFASRVSLREWKKLTENPDHPLQNRVIQNTFAPGSIFKPIIALAGLEAGLINSRTAVYCNGAVKLYGHPFRCWNSNGHGLVSLREAIQQSCNIYFYLLGNRLGIDRISEFARRLGLGSRTGIGLPGEVPGLVPSKEWKERVLNQKWYDGETISVSIGQGPIDVTPVQLARALGMIATGKITDLHLVAPSESTPPKEPMDLGIDERHLDLVRHAMFSAVSEFGTGRGAMVEGFNVCGKTGTAQTISAKTREQLSEEEQKRFEPNAWFVGFAPLEEPEVVVAVIVQKGGSGGSGAAPLAGEIFRLYRDKYKSGLSPKLELASLIGQ